MGAFVASWSERVAFAPGSAVRVETFCSSVVYADNCEDASDAVVAALRSRSADYDSITVVDVSDKLRDPRPIPPRPAMLQPLQP